MNSSPNSKIGDIKRNPGMYSSEPLHLWLSHQAFAAVGISSLPLNSARLASISAIFLLMDRTMVSRFLRFKSMVLRRDSKFVVTISFCQFWEFIRSVGGITMFGVLEETPYWYMKPH